MSILAWTYVWVIGSFALYIGIAFWTRVRSTAGFYIAGQHVPPLLNGMATAADWMSAASFLSMAGLISFMGFGGAQYLLGWTGGFVLLALLLAPYLRKFGRFTVPDFVGDRYYSDAARLVAVLCAIFISFTYIAGQMRGVGVVFSRFLGVSVDLGVGIGTLMVLLYATIGGMKGVTYTQVVQFVILIVAYLAPVVAISLKMTGQALPQLGLGAAISEGPKAGLVLLEALNQIHADLGFAEYTKAPAWGSAGMLNMLAVTVALMVGTAGLPHVIVRFYTVPSVRGARYSAFWALAFIALLYTTAPAVAAFARVNLLQTLDGRSYAEAPVWFKSWESTRLLAWVDKNGDGRIQIRPGDAVKGRPSFTGQKGSQGQMILANQPTEGANELYVDRDIIVLALPEIADLSPWLVGLVAAGALAAALSTAAGLLLVISSAISHDLLKRVLAPNLSEKRELLAARLSAALAVLVAGHFGLNPPAFVAQVVAFAFGLAASTFFPVIVLGIFSRRANKEGAISGMLAGLIFTGSYIIYFNFLHPDPGAWWWGISPEGIGSLGMLLNFAVALTVSHFTPPPPKAVQDLVDSVRLPQGAGKAGAAH